MCLSAVLCTAGSTTEVSKVFASKQEKQTVRSKRQEVGRVSKGKRKKLDSMLNQTYHIIEYTKVF